MKKYLLISLCFVAGSMLAAETAYVGMKLTGETTATATNYKIRVTENDAYTHGFDDGADAEILSLNPSNSQSVFLYALVGNKTCSSIYDNLIQNLEVGFQTNRVDSKYSITFTSASGRELKFYDKVADSMFVITKDFVYTFEVNTTNCPSYVAGANIRIDNRFVIEPVFHFQVCAYYDNVQIIDNMSPDNIVITDMAGAEVVNVAPVKPIQTIDLSDKPAGHYILTVNGTQYEFCNKPVSE